LGEEAKERLNQVNQLLPVSWLTSSEIETGGAVVLGGWEVSLARSIY